MEIIPPSFHLSLSPTIGYTFFLIYGIKTKPVASANVITTLQWGLTFPSLPQRRFSWSRDFRIFKNGWHCIRCKPLPLLRIDKHFIFKVLTTQCIVFWQFLWCFCIKLWSLNLPYPLQTSKKKLLRKQHSEVKLFKRSVKFHLCFNRGLGRQSCSHDWRPNQRQTQPKFLGTVSFYFTGLNKWRTKDAFIWHETQW